MVTEDLLMVERKYHDARQIKNFVRVVMASNNPWVIAASGEERRFCVLQVSNARMQNKDYFAALNNEMENGGREALLHYLMAYEITEDLRTIPMTDALLDQKVESLGSVESFWLAVLERGALLEKHDLWNQIVAKSRIHVEFQKYARDRGDRHPLDPVAFGMRLSKLCPSREVTKTTTLINGNQPHRENAYRFPALQKCREEFVEHMQTQFDWPSEDDIHDQVATLPNEEKKTWSNVTDVRIPR